MRDADMEMAEMRRVISRLLYHLRLFGNDASASVRDRAHAAMREVPLSLRSPQRRPAERTREHEYLWRRADEADDDV